MAGKLKILWRWLNKVSLKQEQEQSYKLSLLRILSGLNMVALFTAGLILGIVAALAQLPLIYIPALANILCGGLACGGYWLAKAGRHRPGSQLLVLAWLIAIITGYGILGTALPLPLVLIIPIAMTAALLTSHETWLIAIVSLLISGLMYICYDFLRIIQPPLTLSRELLALLDLALVLICIPVIVALFVVPTNLLLKIIRSQNRQLQVELLEKQQAEELQRQLANENAQLYQQSQEALLAQEELVQLKDYFLSVVSHDLRTPLTAIRGYSSLLKQRILRQSPLLVQADTTSVPNSKSPEEANSEAEQAKNLRMIETVLHQTERMAELIARLLEFSRLQAGRPDLQLVPNQDLVSLVRQVVENQQVTSPQHSLILDLNAPGQEIRITYDEARLEQVLDNLIGNAIKYSPPETTIVIGITTRLVARSEYENNNSPNLAELTEVVVWIKDEGYGIPLEEQKHLFEQYYRSQNKQTRHVKGLGLGLYISREIVKQHGGRLWLESKPGQGSIFYFSLPLE